MAPDRSVSRLRLRRRLSVSAGSLTLMWLLAAPAAHGASGGGVTLATTPQSEARAMIVRKITCVRGCSSIEAAHAGATLRFQGPRLTDGKRVVYLGASGPEDDVLAKLTVRGRGHARTVTAVVPQRAASGPVAIEVAPGARSAASEATITLPTPLTPIAGNGPFFPVRGAYRFGTGTAAFGGGRNHQGEDVFARCGTPLVAAEGGEVIQNAYQSRAGNYVVIQVAGAERAEAYMHLRRRANVSRGDVVAAGEPIGEVGQTGRADGCHLHFELWLGHWRGVGGHSSEVIDPLPTLKQWADVDTTLTSR